MMPSRVVTLHRWQVVGAFLVMVLLSISVALWNDRRIDAAEKRITVNAAHIAAARTSLAESRAKARVITETARAQRETIAVLCHEIGAVKGQIVATLKSSRGQAESYVGRLPGYTEHDAQLSEMRLEQAIKRFAPRPCPPRAP